MRSPAFFKLLPVLVLVAATLPARVSAQTAAAQTAAAGTKSGAVPCYAAAVFGAELDRATIDTIVRACRSQASEKGDDDRLASAFRLLSFGGGWKVTLLRHLLPATNWPKSAADSSKKLRSLLGSTPQPCGVPASAFIDYERDIRNKIVPKPPVRHELWPIEKCAPPVSADDIILTVLSAATTGVTAYVGGASPYVEQLGAADGFRIDGQNDFAYLFVLPRNAPITIEIEGLHTLSGLPLLFNWVTRVDDVLQTSVPTGCLNLDINRNESAVLLVDGYPVQKTFLDAIAADRSHELVIVSKDRGVLHSRTVEGRELLNAERCSTVKMDLSVEPTITLLSASVSELCSNAGIAESTLLLRISEYLRKVEPHSQKRFRDFAGWAEVAGHFRKLETVLSALGGEKVGATKGNLSTSAQLGSAAQELLRKGVEVLLSAELSCTRSTPEQNGWQYTFLARKIDLKKLAERPSDSREGLMLEGVLATESESADTDDDLYRAVATPLARLLDVPYVRFAPARPHRSFYDAVRFEVETYVPAKTPGQNGPGPACRAESRANEYRVVLRASWLSERKRVLDICSPLEADMRLRSARTFRPREATDVEDRRLEDFTTEVTADCTASPVERKELAFSPRKRGTYLMEASIETEGGDVIAKDFRCVDIVKPSGRAWFQLSHDWGFAAAPTSGESNRLVRLLGGWQSQSNDGLESGILVGYAYAMHRGTTAPSWQDGLLVPVGPDGTSPYTWTRHAVLFGPSFSLELSPCGQLGACGVPGRRWRFLARVAPMLDMGFIAPDDRALALASYTGGQDGAIFDPRGALLVQGGVDLQWDDVHNVSVLLDVAQSGGWLDFRRIADSRTMRIGYEGEWSAGVAIEMGWGL